MNERVEEIRRRLKSGATEGALEEALIALAQAEREREDEIVKLRADVVWIAQQRDENEQWARDRAAVAIQMADERDAARAEVERWKKRVTMLETEEKWEALKQAEADLARVQEILTGACARYDHWYVNGASCEAGNMAYELVSAMRAAMASRKGSAL